MTLEIWNPTFKNIGNRLHAHGNQLLLCKIVIKLFGLLIIDYCLLVIGYQRVKTLVKDFSLKNSFGQIVLFNLFFEFLFYLLNRLSLLLPLWANLAKVSSLHDLFSFERTVVFFLFSNLSLKHRLYGFRKY